jgi:hypothetical protein
MTSDRRELKEHALKQKARSWHRMSRRQRYVFLDECADYQFPDRPATMPNDAIDEMLDAISKHFELGFTVADGLLHKSIQPTPNQLN